MVAGPVVRRQFGQRLGGLLLGGGAGFLAFIVTSSLLLAGGAGLLALLYTWIFAGRGGPVGLPPSRELVLESAPMNLLTISRVRYYAYYRTSPRR